MIIKGGTLIDTIKDTAYRADIVIRDGKIAKIIPKTDADASADPSASDNDILDATDLYIAPGMADTHVHFRDPGFEYKEDIESGAKAAAAGGYTQIVLMANTNPHVDNEETLSYVIEKGKKTPIHINTCANVTRNMAGKELTDMESLKNWGAVGFTDDGVPILNEELCLEAMRKCAELDVPISFHEENPAFIDNNGINRGRASEHFNIGGSPREAEIDLIKRDIELGFRCIKEYGLNPKLVIQHISTREGVAMVRDAKERGLNIHAEATPHHFTLTEEAVIEHGTLAKMNPPLRTLSDKQAIKVGLMDGTIDLIATDHAPHADYEKNKPLTEAPSGIIGLETALSLAIEELINPGFLTYPQLFNRISLAPCRLYGLEGGSIEETLNADLVIFDPKATRVAGDFKSKSSNSPFKGKIMQGVIKHTICGGKIVYSNT